MSGGVAERQGRNENGLLRQSSLEFGVVVLREVSLVIDRLILFLYFAETAVIADVNAFPSCHSALY